MSSADLETTTEKACAEAVCPEIDNTSMPKNGVINKER